MKDQRFVFGEAPELYDRARAGYPPALVDDVLSWLGPLQRPARALEVGAGTGKATVAFAQRGLEILALEPSPEMAAVAVASCRRFPRVRVEPFTFEGWPGETGSFDLVFAAQSWHWVDPSVRYVKSARSLRPGGTLALFWHRTAWRGEPLWSGLGCSRPWAGWSVGWAARSLFPTSPSWPWLGCAPSRGVASPADNPPAGSGERSYGVPPTTTVQGRTRQRFTSPARTYGSAAAKL
ncbi:MAG TPA: class I SAM-dependent methyltransferase [Candidatus Binatia bacterium]|nr:class I SAM-dependent methyltransferase [Candidatus Binatia bacterium]